MYENENLKRLNAYLSDVGFCSRREADDYIKKGYITINDKIAILGDKVGKKDIVKFKGNLIHIENKKIILAFNKPRGIVCTTKNDKNNIVDFIKYETRIYPIGRLDKDSCGLIFLTNDGSIVNHILKSSNNKEKEYIVRVNKDITKEFIDKLEKGVHILDRKTKPCKIEKIDKKMFKIIITEGLNRQIRRMCEVCGYKCVYLKRIRIMNIKLNNLKEGTYRKLTEEEVKELLK